MPMPMPMPKIPMMAALLLALTMVLPVEGSLVPERQERELPLQRLDLTYFVEIYINYDRTRENFLARLLNAVERRQLLILKKQASKQAVRQEYPPDSSS
jgi:hypothetical protein